MLGILGGLLIGVVVLAIAYAWWSAVHGFKRKQKRWAAIDRLKKKSKR
jgi:hypothetical protein